MTVQTFSSTMKFRNMPNTPILNKSTKLAILVPSVRWNDHTRALIASTVGTANEEIAVLIGDNSECNEKKEFLKKISQINSNVSSVSHTKNIGAMDNMTFLLDWCKDVEYVAMIGDDDWMTHCYFPNALEALKNNPNASCCEAGTAFVDFGDGKPFDVSQPSMTGASMMQRLTNWNAVIARVTMYSASKRSAIQAAVDFQKLTPIHGLTMAENLWELNRLAVGDFLRIPAPSYFIHYPANASNQGNQAQRFYNLLCKDAGLALPALDFMDLCSAIQCALFLMGKLSPLPSLEERFVCGQQVFRHIYTQQFIKKFGNSCQKNNILSNITSSRLRARLLEYISPPYADNPVLTEDLISIFVDLMDHFQVEKRGVNLSHRLKDFFDELLPFSGEGSTPNKFVIPEFSTGETWNTSIDCLSSQSPMENQTESLPYDIWLNNRNLALSHSPQHSQGIPVDWQDNILTFICRAPSQQFMLLASTLDSLAACDPARWKLVVVSDIAAPDDCSDIDRIHWLQDSNAQVIKAEIDQTVQRLGSDWVIEIPCGSKIDSNLFEGLIAIDQKSIKAVFVDDDIYDESGQRKSPRFKPGVNPAALQSADLAGPVFIRQNEWLAIGGASQVQGSPWFSQLIRLADTFGWNSIKHLPDILISYPEKFPSHTESCLHALLNLLGKNNIKGEIVPVTGQSWNIRYPLDTTPIISIALISTGQLDLLERCIDSIIEKTEYPEYELIVVLKDTNDDPDLNNWLVKLQEQEFPKVRLIRALSTSSYANRCNIAISTSPNEFVLLIKEDAVIIQTNWLTELVRTVLQPNIAGVSPRLIYPGTSLIHYAGNVFGLQGIIASPYQNKAKLSDHGYLDCIQIARDVSALSDACALVRKADYLAVGGMDETELGDYYASADLYLKLLKLGRRLIYQPFATAAYGGSATFIIDIDVNKKTEHMLTEARATETFLFRWKKSAAVDPFWNQNLSLNSVVPTPETDYRAQWQHLPSKAPRILARPLINGQGVFRITSPLGALCKAGMATECIWPQEGAREPSIAEILQLAPDALIVQHYLYERHLEALMAWHAAPGRPFTIYTIDDLITKMDENNPFRKHIPSNSRSRLKFAMERCDRMVVSTEYLAESYRHFADDIRVVPNRLEQDIWLPLRSSKRTTSRPRIGWAGGTTHQGDLILLKEIIEATRGEADWIFFGMCPNEIRPLLSEYHPLADFSSYPADLAALNLDIAVAPLDQIPFNQGKSNLRLLEYGILGIPVVCTDIEPYRNSPACRVANTSAAWTEALRARIHDADGREQEGNAMRKWVHQHYLLENYLEEWLSAHLPS